MICVSEYVDCEIVRRVEHCSCKEHEALLELLLYLAELDQRKLYLGLGYTSLFAYCTKKLGYSEPAAHRRILSCRCIRKYPQVFEALKTRGVSLTTVAIFSKILTIENISDILSQVCNKSKDQVEQIVVKYSRPVEHRTESIRTIRPFATRVKPVLVNKPVTLPLLEQSTHAHGSLHSTEMTSAKPNSKEAEAQYKISLYIDQDLMHKVNRLKELKPYRTLEELFGLVLEEYLKAHAPESRPVDPNANSKNPSLRYVPAKLRTRVLRRDDYRCSYVSPDGTRCAARHDLELDHIVPFSRGGLTETDNLRALCSVHNRFEAVRILGAQTMAQFVK